MGCDSVSKCANVSSDIGRWQPSPGTRLPTCFTIKSSNHGLVNNNNHSLAKYDINFDILFKIIGKILLQNGKKKGYEELNDLALHTDPCLNSTANIEKTLEIFDDEILNGVLTVKGLDNWTKQHFLDLMMGIARGFRFLSNYLLARLTSRQRSRFVDAITSTHTNHSF